MRLVTCCVLALSASVSAETFVVTSLSVEGEGTLRQAVEFATQNGPRPDVIDMTGLVGVIRVATPLVLETSMQINGPGADALKLTGLTTSRVFEIAARATIRDLTIIDGFAQEAGAILNTGDLSIEGVRFIENYAAVDGGAIVNEGTLDVQRCMFDENEAIAGFGGAIADRGKGLSVEDSDFTLNRAELGGVVVFVDGLAGATSFVDCRFSQNGRRDYLGGAYAIEYDVTPDERGVWHSIAGCTFTANLGCLRTSAQLEITNSLFENNLGGLRQEDGTLVINRTTVFSNYTYGSGAGVQQKGGELFMTQCTVSDNRAVVGLGGGLRLGGTFARIVQSTITDNYGQAGAGIQMDGSVIVEIGQSLVAGNIGESVYGQGSVMSLGHNIAGFPWDMWDLQPTDITFYGGLDVIGFAPLGDNGGATPTHPVLPNSVTLDAGSLDLAVDAFTGEPLLFDQRGPRFPRLQGGAVDIGAVERKDP